MNEEKVDVVITKTTLLEKLIEVIKTWTRI